MKTKTRRLLFNALFSLGLHCVTFRQLIGGISAHLSRRLICELIVYPCSCVRRPSVVVSDNFKHFLLRNRWANRSQILCGASMGRGTKICPRHLGHMPMYGKNLSKIFFPGTSGQIPTKLGLWHRGLRPIIVCSNGKI